MAMKIDTSVMEVLKTAQHWMADGHAVELVTVARTWGSSPRPPGSIAAVRDDGLLVGSVSGGCIEKQLVENFTQQSLARTHTHHVDDEQAKRFGLACGGELELVFESLNEHSRLPEIITRLERRERVKRQVSVGDAQATLLPAARDDQFSWHDGLLQQVFGPSWRVLVVGAGQLSRYTAQFAVAVDFDVIVVDPRESFHAAWALADIPCLLINPDEAVLEYANDPCSAVLALSHDPNIDDLALLEALPGDAFYVGALGSRRNYEKRCRRLAGLDVSEQAIARLQGPVGLAIGSRTSSEIAISIVAELIQVRNSIS